VGPNSSLWTVQDYGALHLNHRLFAPTLTEMILEAQFKEKGLIVETRHLTEKDCNSDLYPVL
jgi:hypothetical protein